jgi:hypothetical protein
MIAHHADDTIYCAAASGPTEWRHGTTKCSCSAGFSRVVWVLDDAQMHAAIACYRWLAAAGGYIRITASGASRRRRRMLHDRAAAAASSRPALLSRYRATRCGRSSRRSGRALSSGSGHRTWMSTTGKATGCQEEHNLRWHDVNARIRVRSRANSTFVHHLCMPVRGADIPAAAGTSSASGAGS